MQHRKTLFLTLLLMATGLTAWGLPATTPTNNASIISCDPTTAISFDPAATLSRDTLANALGWVETGTQFNRCGGYYIEPPISYPQSFLNSDQVEITSSQGLVFAQHGTSISQGAISIVKAGQLVTANKGYLYRDPKTGKLSTIDLLGNVHLREPNVLVISTQAHYNIITKAKSLMHALYRQAIYADDSTNHPDPSYQQQQTTRKVTQLSAWGQAKTFTQDEPYIYNFYEASYSTCPPLTNTWRVRASHINLNKITGRGYATNARLYVQGIPVFYTPYMNFPIDARRQTGFLMPRFGTSNQLGKFIMLPFYWNIAPNYDMTFTPAYYSKRGFQLSDRFRYLTPYSNGIINAAVLPYDRGFTNFQQTQQNTFQTIPMTTFQQSDLRRLENADTTRKALSWQDQSVWNDNWSGNVDFNYVSDDYYVRNLGGNLDTTTDNQLLQQGELDFNSEHWDIATRYQGYQTLNQVDTPNVTYNQYTKAPQFLLGGHGTEDNLGLEYFVNNEVSRFYMSNTPGDPGKYPMGERVNVQPGISRPVTLPYFYFTPRVQFAMTKYIVGDVKNDNSNTPSRGIPIIDLNTGLYFDRETNLFGGPYKQTLEPQLYYTYIPYKNQDQLPVYDTTVSTVTYDQLFNYNRFTSIDRIGDTSQVAAALTTRYIDEDTGAQKITAVLGQIYYFKKRLVTLCDSPEICASQAIDTNNTTPHGPLTGGATYYMNPDWSFTDTTIWNVQHTRADTQAATIQYKPTEDLRKIVNLTYTFSRANPNQILVPGQPNPNLSQTDLSFSWPITRDWSAVGRWTENWNTQHFQNMLGGLQYDSCCYAIRLVGGRAFVQQNVNGTYQYNPQVYMEFALKGLGTWGPQGDSSTLLSNSIPSYQSNFGRDF